MLDAYLDYSYYLVYIFYFEILEEKNHDFCENWELMIHTNEIGQKDIQIFFCFIFDESTKFGIDLFSVHFSDIFLIKFILLHFPDI